jgi:hypothetical protein
MSETADVMFTDAHVVPADQAEPGWCTWFPTTKPGAAVLNRIAATDPSAEGTRFVPVDEGTGAQPFLVRSGHSVQVVRVVPKPRKPYTERKNCMLRFDLPVWRAAGDEARARGSSFNRIVEQVVRDELIRSGHVLQPLSPLRRSGRPPKAA